jgi:D-glycero-D-manno-heptose 1,7-bisphosphate phosphatase
LFTESLRRPAVFLDRDGVINENRPDHVKSWDEFVFLPGVFEPLRLLARVGRPIVVVSNQAVINRGLVSRETVEGIHRQMCAEIAHHGGRVDAVYYCPHRPDESCECRKPRPGLLLRAASELRLDLARSYFIGDAFSDVEAALAAGCSPVLVLTGRGQGQSILLRERDDHVPVVSDLAGALGLISG